MSGPPAVPAPTLAVLAAPTREAWWEPLLGLEGALAARNAVAAERAAARLAGALVAAEARDPADAVAAALLWCDNPLAAALGDDAEEELPPGLRRAAERDLARLAGLARRDWEAELEGLLGAAPPLRELARCPLPEVRVLADALRREEPDVLRSRLEERYRRHGAGDLARYRAFRWNGEGLVGVARPAAGDPAELVGLGPQLAELHANTRAFLAGRPAQHVLLYGPRGSGKSTAVRSLLRSHGDDGLRLVELPAERLEALPEVAERLRTGRHRYLLFVDDLSFETGDAAYHPLKSLLEGSLAGRPERVLLAATSNRRHLVRERFSDRPDPLDDDPHAWDTQHERLALADRFGLLLTFPETSQARYLQIAEALAARAGLAPDGLRERALRFAARGNGFSGRTARQFVDAVLAEG